MTRAQAAIAASRGLARAGRDDSGKLWAGVLAEVPLFAGVPKRHVRKIAELVREARYQEGSVIVRRGEPGNDVFVVVDGRASVELPGGLAPVELGPGEFFGEMALIDGGARSATVAAASELLCLRLTRAAFTKIVRHEPEIALAVMRELAARLRALQARHAL